MNFNIKATPGFLRSLKVLSKRHRSMKADFAEFAKSLQDNPYQGDELSPGIRKIRMAISSKGRGKSGGARVITYTVIVAEDESDVYLIDIYDKSDFSTVDVDAIKAMIAVLGL